MSKKHTPSKKGRTVSVKLKTARGRSNSSQQWLRRQLSDPFVQQAKLEGYRSRAAYKLIELQNRFNLVRENSIVVDLGAAPGGWTQVIKKFVSPKNGKIYAVDILEMEPMEGVEVLLGDFMSAEFVDQFEEKLKGSVDVVLSDMAPSTIGHKSTDHLRIIVLVESALYFAMSVLKEGGHFVAKVRQGGTEHNLLKILKESFSKIYHVKPEASRKESSEMYLIALGFKGRA